MNPLVQPDPGLFIWTIITFLVLLALLTKFAWGPLLRSLDARQESIRKSLAEAEDARRDLEKLRQESELIIRNAHVEAGAIVSRSLSDSNRLKEEMKAKARTEAETILRDANRQIQLETQTALQQIRYAAADLSVMLASKIIERNLTKEDNDRLIEEALQQIEVGHDNQR